jgi:tRNA nucleotidyltransferase (CCA-adding enzyme)
MSLPRPPHLQEALKRLHTQGASPLIVGGAVRDWLLGENPKDIDVEVYGLPADRLEAVLGELGETDLVGKSFGVYKVKIEGETFDFSLPRRDSKIPGRSGHRAFDVKPDETLSPLEASLRRDFTVNSLFYDPITERLEDPHGGAEDLKSKILRHTSTPEAFVEDPLRALRAVQFSARFDMRIDPKTAKLCQDMAAAGEHLTLSTERITEEIKKFLIKGKHHRRGTETWREIGWLKHNPELAALDGLEQDPEWHPEGDALTHTMFCLEALHRIPRFQGLSDDEKCVYALGVLCHDLGKPATSKTEWRESLKREVITSHNHHVEGTGPTRSLLERWGFPEDTIRRAQLLTLYHMEHLWAKTPKDVRQLAARLSPLNPHSVPARITETIRGLAFITEADHSGRPPLTAKQPEAMQKILALAEKEGCLEGPLRAAVQGSDLLGLGLPQGKALGNILRMLYAKQIEGGIKTKEEAMTWLKKNTRKVSLENGGPPPLITGHTLEVMGIPKGKLYGEILEQSYKAQLDGKLKSPEEIPAWLEENAPCTRVQRGEELGMA